MKVSQYIYTACGKDRTGAFSVFSKSKDVTDAEGAEIREVMMYKTPAGLPYEPTEQEIEELFPKKFGYFFLSSKRACIAQVCYIGKVYSDLDERVGNYIIHAFVFDKNKNFIPYGFIEHSVFKRFLTKAEWHDNPIPEELPQIEIPESVEITDVSKPNKLELLLEGVINSTPENPVCFCDDYKNIKNWLRALSVCLPKAMQSEISFCTHFTNTLLQGNISSKIQLRANQPETSMFRYAEEAQKKRFVFDFKKNIFPVSLQAGKYAEGVVKAEDTAKYVESVCNAMSKFSVNINEAADILHLSKINALAFENVQEVFKAIALFNRIKHEDLASKYLLALIKTHAEKEEFIRVYSEARNTAPAFFSKIEADPVAADFLKRRDAFNFYNQAPTFEAIKVYFSKYYATDKERFTRRVEEYLKEQPIEECLHIYDALKSAKEIHCIILEIIFAMPFEKILEQIEKVKSIYDSVNASDLKPETNELALIVFKKDFGSVSSSKGIDIVIEHYFSYISVNDIEKFKKIFEEGDIEKILDKLLKEPRTDFILFIFKKLLLNSPEKFDKRLGELAEKFFVKLPAGDRKKLFAELQSKAKADAEVKQFKEYFEKFNKEHGGGGGFFGLFKGKK